MYWPCCKLKVHVGKLVAAAAAGVGTGAAVGIGIGPARAVEARARRAPNTNVVCMMRG
jgi:hypothetical protein